jgi:hypothetical protein
MGDDAPHGRRDPLRRFFNWLDFWPESDPADPWWRHWHARPGDVIEVVASNPRFLKLADERVFEQAGWPVFSGKGARLRWPQPKP